MFTVELQGMDKVRNLFKDMGAELTPSKFRSTLDDAGRIIVKEAKQQEEYPGQLGEAFKKDLSVYRDTRKSARNVEWILVGPRFKPYLINGRQKKAAMVVQHITSGFTQHARKTSAGLNRGVVSSRFVVKNPMISAFNAKRNELNAGVQKGVVRVVNKLKAKYSV